MDDFEFPSDIIKNNYNFGFVFTPSEEISENTNIEYAQSTIIQDLDFIGTLASRGVTEESLVYSSLPVIDCYNSTFPVFEFVKSADYSVIVDNNCIIINAEETTLSYQITLWTSGYSISAIE